MFIQADTVKTIIEIAFFRSKPSDLPASERLVLFTAVAALLVASVLEASFLNGPSVNAGRFVNLRLWPGCLVRAENQGVPSEMATNNFGAVWDDLHRPDIDVYSYLVRLGNVWRPNRRKRHVDPLLSQFHSEYGIYASQLLCLKTPSKFQEESEPFCWLSG